MKRITSASLHHPVFCALQERDERELYTDNPVDYYALHYRRRIAAVCDVVKKRRAKRVLEVGAAQGNMSLICSESGCFSIAVDIDFNHLSYSRMKYEKGDIAWVQAGADALPFKGDRFDAVVLGELLEHCAWPERILASAAEMLENDGVMIITTPNHSYVNSCEKSFSEVSGDRPAMEKFQFGPDGEHHLFTFTGTELKDVVVKAGLTVIGLRFIGNHFLHFPFLYHLRTMMPFFFNGFLEAVVPLVPLLRGRFTSALLLVAGKGRQGR